MAVDRPNGKLINKAIMFFYIILEILRKLIVRDPIILFAEVAKYASTNFKYFN